MTRGAFLVRGALAAGAVYGAGAAGPFLDRALAQSDATDSAVLDFALSLENLESAFYERAAEVLGPKMSAEVKEVTGVLRDDEHEHRQLVSDTIRQLGIVPSGSQEFDFGSALGSEEQYLETAQALEDLGVSAYNGSVPRLFARRIIQVAGSIVQVEARHAATLRDLRGERITDGAFDKPLTEAQTAEKIRAYIKH